MVGGKTLSFLAYIIRTYPAVIRKHKPPIPTFVLQLMQNCPAEASSTRKVRPHLREWNVPGNATGH